MVRFDCRHYVGYKPCKHKRLCDGCDVYDKVESRILIIKLGALGDLLRTTPILPSIKARYPKSHITWITRADCTPLLANLSEIDKLWVTDERVTARVLAEKFDLVINFDKDTPAVELATIAQAKEKRGFGLTSSGALTTFNAGSEYALQLGLDDDLKFRRNDKTYQQIAHEMAELKPFGAMPNYQVRLTKAELKFGADWLAENLHGRDNHVVLGINPGAGRVFATKKWQPEKYIELATRLHRDKGVIPLILGGADEIELNEHMTKALRKQHVPVLRPGEKLDLRQFISVVAQCDGFLAGDTLAMHIALAMNLPTTVIFTSTCWQEIELYGTGRAIIGKALCAPCYLSKCKQPSQFCSDDVSIDAVYKSVAEQLKLDALEHSEKADSQSDVS